jgi:hypothetical protein
VTDWVSGADEVKAIKGMPEPLFYMDFRPWRELSKESKEVLSQILELFCRFKTLLVRQGGSCL